MVGDARTAIAQQPKRGPFAPTLQGGVASMLWSPRVLPEESLHSVHGRSA